MKDTHKLKTTNFNIEDIIIIFIKFNWTYCKLNLEFAYFL